MPRQGSKDQGGFWGLGFAWGRRRVAKKWVISEALVTKSASGSHLLPG